MTLIRLAVFLLLALLLLFPVRAQPNAGHKQFGRWSSTCASAYCTASTRLTQAGRSGYAYQLRVSRFQSGERELSFLAAAEAPAQNAAIAIAVDRRKPVVLEPGTGYRRAGSSNTFVFESAVSDELLGAMREGQRVTLSYTTAQGKPATVSFSLMGFPQALKFAGIALPAAKAATQAAPATSASVEPAHSAGIPPAEVPSGAADTATPAEVPDAPAQAPADVPVQRSQPPQVPAPVQPSAPALPAPKLDGAEPAAQPRTSGSRKRSKAVLQFACRGNEPSWSLVIDHDNARYLGLRGSEPEAVQLKGKLRITGEGRTPDVDWRGKAPDGSAYKALIQELACADTMADASEGRTSFPYRARLTLPGGKLVHGCCDAGLQIAERTQPAPANFDQAPIADLNAKQPDDWSRFLLELKPAIDACLAKTPGDSAYVTKAWPMDRGLVGVRTRNAVAGWFDCVAQYDGRTVDRFEAVTADAGPLPREGYVLFTPPAGTPPSGNCWQHERVVDAAGAALGWLSTNGC